MNKEKKENQKEKMDHLISAVTAAVVLFAVFLLPQFLSCEHTVRQRALTKTATGDLRARSKPP